MNCVKRMIKIQMIGMLMFAVLSGVITIIIMITPIKETWSYVSIITALTVSSLLVGILQGSVIGKKGLISGFTASTIHILVIMIVVDLFFSGDFKPESKDVILLISLVAGVVGGVIGANADKT